MRMACHCYESPTSTGLYGGYPSACNTRNFLTDTTWRERLATGEMPFDTSELGGTQATFPAKMVKEVTFGAADVYESCPSAGAGWGDPLEREPEVIAGDVRFGEVSPEVAESIYGVVVRGDFSVDSTQTEALRAATREARLTWPVTQRLATAPARSAAGQLVAYHGDKASFEAIGGEVYFRCGCGAVIAPAKENWKNYACTSATEAHDLGPRITLHAELEVNRYACPVCARLLDVEVKRRDEPALFDVEITTRGAA